MNVCLFVCVCVCLQMYVCADEWVAPRVGGWMGETKCSRRRVGDARRRVGSKSQSADCRME